jgi:hypothetical protein
MEVVFATDPELFLLRIWAEPRTLPAEPHVYRARADHAPTSKRRYVKNMREFEEFILECLEEVAFPAGSFDDGGNHD